MALQASCHQGNIKFKSFGKQCLSNSVAAIMYSSKSRSIWDSATLDSILQTCDCLYQRISSAGTPYLTTDDIPTDIAYFENHLYGELTLAKTQIHF